MPSSFVKPGQEDEWEKAKAAAREQVSPKQQPDRFWALTTSIFKKMTGREAKCSARPLVEMVAQGHLSLAQAVEAVQVSLTVPPVKGTSPRMGTFQMLHDMQHLVEQLEGVRKHAEEFNAQGLPHVDPDIKPDLARLRASVAVVRQQLEQAVQNLLRPV